MPITTKNRKQLKTFFVKNAIPTEGNFAELIDAQLNQAEDGVFKLAGEPLSVVAASGEQRRALRLYGTYPAANPDWHISLSPAQDPAVPASVRPGFGVTDGAGNTRLFIDPATGNLGVGTNNPPDRLSVQNGDIRIEGGRSRKLKIISDKHWAGIELVARQQGEAGSPFIDFTQGDLDTPDFGIRVSGPTNNILRVEAGAGAANLQVAGNVGMDGILGVGTMDPKGALDVRVAGAANFDRFVVTTSNAWGDGDTQQVTIGGGEPGRGFMINNPHVSWYAAEGRASIRYGRSGGFPGGAFWDVGVRPNNAFSFAVNGGGDHKMWLLDNGNVGIGQYPETRFDVNGNAQIRGDFEVQGSSGLGWARTNDNFNSPQRTGFYQSSGPIGRVPDVTHPWCHLINLRHGNGAAHYALQIASTYSENDKLYFRKTARGDLGQSVAAWNEVATVTNGILKINEWTIEANGIHLFIKRAGAVVARFSVDNDRFLVFKNLNNAVPFFYFNAQGNSGVYNG